jgi:hypothetical protein
MELTLIKFNDERGESIPIIKGKEKILKEYVKLNGDSKYKKFKANILYLISGINYIPKEYWEECKKHKSIAFDIEEKRIEEVNEKSFKDLSVMDKENILKETFDIRSLELFKIDSDEATDYKINKRIDEIRNAKTDETIGHPKSHLKNSGK